MVGPARRVGLPTHDILSLGFIASPAHAQLVAASKALVDLDEAAYDAIFLVGGQGPMVTFAHEPRVHEIVRRFYEAGKVVGRSLQPFRIEDEASSIEGTSFIVNARFREFAVRDGLLITGQQQYSGGAAARLVIEALGV